MTSDDPGMDAAKMPAGAGWTSILEATPHPGERVWTFCAFEPWTGRQLEVREFRGLDRAGDAVFRIEGQGDVVGGVTHWRRLQ